MARRFHAYGKPDGSLSFGTDVGAAMFREFLKENPGIKLIITPNEEITSQMRRFFEGAIVPYFAYQHLYEKNGQLQQLSLDDARECLKREFNPVGVYRLDGSYQTVGGSTTELNRAKFSQFIEKILEWFIDNGYEIPDTEAYQAWVDSAPPPGEEYPGLVRLKREAQRKINLQKAARKRSRAISK